MGFRKKAFLEAIDDVNWNYYWKINGLYNENVAIALDEKCHHRLLVPYGINFNNIKGNINLNNVQMMPQGYNYPSFYPLYPYTEELGKTIGLDKTGVSTILKAIDKQTWSLAWGISEEIGKIDLGYCNTINIGSEHHFILLPEADTTMETIPGLKKEGESNTEKTQAVIPNIVEYVDEIITKAASKKDIHLIGYFSNHPSSSTFKAYPEHFHRKFGDKITFKELKTKLKEKRKDIRSEGTGSVENILVPKGISPTNV